jgi:hypothetical protein
MTPQAALDAQITRYRAMDREQRVAIALRLHELACEMARLGIRRQNPKASIAEVEELLRRRIELAITLWPDKTAELQAALSGGFKNKQT